MQNDNAWTYGPTGLPVESTAVHSHPTLVMRTVPSLPRRRSWAKRLLCTLVLFLLVLTGTGVFLWFDPLALATLSMPFLPPQPDVVPWNGTDTINILAMGVDQRAQEIAHSDTMLVITLNPSSKQVRLVSIPRDLAVAVPGFGPLGKVNQAYAEGGPRFAAFTLEHSLGIPINYYAVLHFSNFVDLIDALGGVDITVDRNINDQQYPADQGYGFSPFVISAGMHHMDGATALRYVRERHAYMDVGGDQIRNKHQQQVIAALKSQAFSFHTLFHLPSILSALRATIHTNLPDNMLPVVGMLMLQDRTIEHVYVNQENGLVYNCVGADQGADLCPTPALQPTLDSLFHNQQVLNEHASVWVQNGTGSAVNLSRTLTALNATHFVVAGSGPADNNHHAHTAVIVNSSQLPAPYTTRLLRQLFGARLETRAMPDIPARIVLLLGKDIPHQGQ